MKTTLCACFGSEEAKYSIGLIKEKKICRGIKVKVRLERWEEIFFKIKFIFTQTNMYSKYFQNVPRNM